MSVPQHDTLEDFDITTDELGKIKEALKNQEFRDLFKNYVEEINDPENRKLYEKEIVQLERERGYAVEFIHPKIGYVIKTSSNGTTKTYINVCSNPNIEPPSSAKSNQNGSSGLNWSIPYLLTPLKKIFGRNKNILHVYDAVFHPDTLHLASKNEKFRDAVNHTALEGVESSFKIELDKKNLKFLNVKYKGAQQPTVVRKKLNNVDDPPKYDADDIINKLKFGEHKVFQPAPNETTKLDESVSKENSPHYHLPDSDYAVPKYRLKYRSSIDYQDFTDDSLSKINAATPKELVVIVSLPLLKSTSDANLDITGEKLSLVCETPAKYKLEINLPYSVYESKGKAVFDKSLRTLTVTLPVAKIEENLVKAFEYLREDSGVESDRTSGTSSIEDDSAFSSDGKTNILDDEQGCSAEECANPDCDILESPKNCDKNIHYSFPKFTTNYTDSTLAFTLHIKNIDASSLSKKLLKNNTAILLHLYSIGSGHFPSYYSFYVDLTKPFEPSAVNVEIWDNSVIVHISLHSEPLKSISYYYVGLNENDCNLSKLELPHPAVVAENFCKVKDQCKHNENYGITVSKNDAKEVNIDLYPITDSKVSKNTAEKVSINSNSDDELVNGNNVETETNVKLQQEESSKPNQKSSRRKKRRCNSVGSEFAAETSDLPSSIDNYNFAKIGSTKQRRGILKYSRSLSESEPADFSLYSSEYSCSLHDCSEFCRHDNSNHKSHDKRVRFSDVVSSKTFRSNVSILSQNKRKQKKQKYKKRAQERRASESETEGDVDLASDDSHHRIPANQNHEVEENASISETSGDTSDGSDCYDHQSSKPPQRNSKARSRKNWQKTKGANTKLRVLNDLIFQLDDV
ncbi:unnamed protein product [Bemisia tabaci]|uniref:Protein kintoun n=1 Tax=Bemisia tabaci TaxID=7038 RepID=A0A9P0EZH4_BEMTA|nr:unnamed protein product [Bemisia tabaci]